MTSYERWSDGRKVGSLFENGGGIRSCSCSRYYQLKYAINLGMMVEPKFKEVWEDTGEDVTFDLPAFMMRQVDINQAKPRLESSYSTFKRLKNWLASKMKIIEDQKDPIKNIKNDDPQLFKSTKLKKEPVLVNDIPDFLKVPKEKKEPVYSL